MVTRREDNSYADIAEIIREAFERAKSTRTKRRRALEKKAPAVTFTSMELDLRSRLHVSQELIRKWRYAGACPDHERITGLISYFFDDFCKKGDTKEAVDWARMFLIEAVALNRIQFDEVDDILKRALEFDAIREPDAATQQILENLTDFLQAIPPDPIPVLVGGFYIDICFVSEPLGHLEGIK